MIRVALERINTFGPGRDLWTVDAGERALKFLIEILLKRHPEGGDGIHGGQGLGTSFMLNPQPLPPRYAAMLSIAQTVIARVELIHEIAVMANPADGQQGGPDSGIYLARFTEHICGSEVRPRWPFPGPPPDWFKDAISGIELALMASEFDRAAKATFDANLRQELENVAGRLAEAGLARGE